VAARNNLTVRVLTSLVALPLLLGLLFFGSDLGWAVLVFSAALAASFELHVFMARGDRFAQLSGMALSLAVSTTTYFAASHARALLTLGFLVPIAGMLLALFRVKNLAGAGLHLMTLLAAPWYIGGLLASLALLRRDWGPGWVLLVLSIAWLADTGGYFVGRRFGKAKLYALVSPNKTWAGLCGALLGGTLAGAVAALTYLRDLPLMNGILLGLLGGGLGQLGDLAESMLKRSAGVKESGRLIPGHGGILDRIDALLVVSPLTYLYALWFAAKP
jgi:phosphatidate cytidylyltransferase